MRLPRDFYERPALAVARDLLGCVLVLGQARACIVETEAYVGPHDLACHASRGRTARTEVMFWRGGHAYVFQIYGMYHCLNAVTGPAGYAAAVLFRAAEPISGLRGRADGPGRLCRALGVDRTFNGVDLCDPRSALSIEPGQGRRGKILRGPRINVDYAGPWAERPYRFHLAENPHVSRPRIDAR